MTISIEHFRGTSYIVNVTRPERLQLERIAREFGMPKHEAIRGCISKGLQSYNMILAECASRDKEQEQEKLKEQENGKEETED